jgi:hypothetical protein
MLIAKRGFRFRGKKPVNQVLSFLCFVLRSSRLFRGIHFWTGNSLVDFDRLTLPLPSSCKLVHLCAGNQKKSEICLAQFVIKQRCGARIFKQITTGSFLLAVRLPNGPSFLIMQGNKDFARRARSSRVRGFIARPICKLAACSHADVSLIAEYRISNSWTRTRSGREACRSILEYFSKLAIRRIIPLFSRLSTRVSEIPAEISRSFTDERNKQFPGV